MIQDILPRAMTLDEFTPYLDAVFTVHCTPRNAEVTLVEAYPTKNSARLDRLPFMLIFHSEPMHVLLEGSYAMRSGAFGPDIVNLIPVMAAPGAKPGHYYQAIFN